MGVCMQNNIGHMIISKLMMGTWCILVCLLLCVFEISNYTFPDIKTYNKIMLLYYRNILAQRINTI